MSPGSGHIVVSDVEAPTENQSQPDLTLEEALLRLVRAFARSAARADHRRNDDQPAKPE
jgi:hypothetical protein